MKKIKKIHNKNQLRINKKINQKIQIKIRKNLKSNKKKKEFPINLK